MKEEGIPLSELKHEAEHFLEQDDAESSVGNFFDLTEVKRRNGEFNLWDAGTPLHAK